MDLKRNIHLILYKTLGNNSNQYRIKNIIEEIINILVPNSVDDIDLNILIDKYGPEGLYILSDKLKQFADKDVEQAIKDSFNIE